ncbi:MAG: DUF7718 family protein [Terrimicrobiaceae bacterium]
MPDKQFCISLEGKLYIIAEFRRDGGKILEFVVRLMINLDDGETEIMARYDTAHGVAHLDQLKRGGKQVEKVWLHNLDFDSAFEYALSEFKTNYDRDYDRWTKSL